ncbi:Crp/Fnr family transcriptional regulator [Senegalia massiliensis]|uniref:Crp/Fnr family transcriptional regulator n=1 Tax=Senegalia massiliensis TaxID=1720316 RepID=A0A845R447_9CLOT|nr:Crp/Fnr family transcriptional regulator [Senegalia massiliensis]NBI08202.1 Crp/Fnr family transcriptional regulator [Senegalia massiliensis]
MEKINQEESNCIDKVPVFNNLTYDEMSEIAMITSHREYQKYETIYLAGEESQRLYVVNSGKVKITRISESGKEQIIRVLEPGDFMGELSLFVPSPLESNAQTLEKTSVCIIEGNKLNQIIKKHPDIAIKILEEISTRLNDAENLIESLGLQDVEQRVANILLELSEGNNKINLKITKRDLASYIGVSRETLSRRLTDLQNKGIIEQEGQRKICILHREKLEDIAKLKV